MIIALFPNTQKRNSKNLGIGIKEFLTSQGVTVVADDSYAKSIEAQNINDIPPESIDFLITLGGDGTILRLIHKYPHLDAPIFAINLGGLGFMADTPISDVYPSLQDLINGDFKISERVMMEGHSSNNETCIAVNDIVIHRATNANLIDLAIHIDGVYLNTFSA